MKKLAGSGWPFLIALAIALGLFVAGARDAARVALALMILAAIFRLGAAAGR